MVKGQIVFCICPELTCELTLLDLASVQKSKTSVPCVDTPSGSTPPSHNACEFGKRGIWTACLSQSPWACKISLTLTGRINFNYWALWGVSRSRKPQRYLCWCYIEIKHLWQSSPGPILNCTFNELWYGASS